MIENLSIIVTYSIVIICIKSKSPTFRSSVLMRTIDFARDYPLVVNIAAFTLIPFPYFTAQR